jgi:hypothetical protein
MQWIDSSEMREIALEIEAELKKLGRLEADITRGRHELGRDPERADIHYSNLALKLHNFYTGCERIFRIIASELNHALPSSYDWHKRLLQRMCLEVEGTRPAVISEELHRELGDFAAFRHVVRNIYGYELDPQRIDRLLDKYPPTWERFRGEMTNFTAWMHQLAAEMEKH